MATKSYMEMDRNQGPTSINKTTPLTSYTPVYQKTGLSYTASIAPSRAISGLNLNPLNRSSSLLTPTLAPNKSQGPCYSFGNKPLNSKNIATVPMKITEIKPVDKPIKINSIHKLFRPNRKRGYALILNHYKFKNDFQSTREGTQFDVEKLTSVFAEFKIETIIRSDLTLSQIKIVVNELKTIDFSKYECFIIVILTHGNRNQNLCACDKSYNFIDEIENPLLQNKTLLDKPKIFMIQACRGSDEMPVIETDSAPARRQTGLAQRNIFKCNATYEGYVSFRNTRNGTIFIQTLCNMLKEVGKTDSIYDIMMKVIDQVSSNSEVAQVPTVESSMIKPFCFGSLLQ